MRRYDEDVVVVVIDIAVAMLVSGCGDGGGRFVADVVIIARRRERSC